MLGIVEVDLYICGMTILQLLNKKHRDAIKQLQDVANPVTEKYGLVISSKKVAKNLKKSPQTIMNYIRGRGKDGYLTDAITQEFQSFTNN